MRCCSYTALRSLLRQQGDEFTRFHFNTIHKRDIIGQIGFLDLEVVVFFGPRERAVAVQSDAIPPAVFPKSMTVAKRCRCQTVWKFAVEKDRN